MWKNYRLGITDWSSHLIPATEIDPEPVSGPGANGSIGLPGGMSWESTVTYHRLINEGVKAERGDLHSAEIAMYSIDFEPMEQLQRSGDWDASARIQFDMSPASCQAQEAESGICQGIRSASQFSAQPGDSPFSKAANAWSDSRASPSG